MVNKKLSQETIAMCIMAGATISSQYSKHEYNQQEATLEHAKKFMEFIKNEM